MSVPVAELTAQTVETVPLSNSTLTLGPTDTAMQAIAFLDSRLTDLSTLQTAIRADIQTYILHPEADGITQINNILQHLGSIHTLYLFGHGEPGVMQLGQGHLSAATVAAAASAIAQWQVQEICLYSCKVAQQPELLYQLHHLTGASVGASSTILGNGNWDLDLQLGVLENLNPLQGEYPHRLPVQAFEINPTGDSSPGEFTSFNGALYFRAEITTNDTELWSIDSGSNPILVGDLNPGPFGSGPQAFTVLNNALFFRAYTDTTGYELWWINGNDSQNPTQPQLLQNIRTGAATSNPSGFTLFNNFLYFSASSGTPGNELWRVNESGTVSSLPEINPTGDSNPSQFFSFNGSLYFQATNGVTGTELWRVDSSNNVSPVQDINPTGDSYPDKFTVFNNALYFRANDGTAGQELYRLDTNGTVTRVQDINPAGDSSPDQLTVFQNTLYFSATDGTTGNELWKVDSNGTASRVLDLNSSGNSDPEDFTEFNGSLYFSALDAVNGRELWRIDSSGNASLVENINPTGNSNPTEFTVLNNKLYFVANNGTTGNELWQIDLDGTVSLAEDINPTGSSNPTGLTVFENNLYFAADNGTTGKELYRFTESPGVTIIEQNGTFVTETGITDTYRVVLNTQPQNNETVTVTINAGAPLKTLDKDGNAITTLTFTAQNWNVAQTVTVQAEATQPVEGSRPVTIAHSSASNDGDYNISTVKSVIVTVTDKTNPPTGVAIDKNTIVENVGPGTTVGQLSTIDPDGGRFAYTLVSNPNNFFSISGNLLQIDTSPDFETQSSYVIRVRTTDIDFPDLIAEQDLTINVSDGNDAPVLKDTSVSLIPVKVNAGNPTGQVGTLVSQLVGFENGTGQKNVTEQDAGATKLGIAITATNSNFGSWFFSTDNGTNWNPLGTVSTSNARLLAADANTRLYFRPFNDYTGSMSDAITFRAWDQSDGITNGSLASTSSNGGSTAFSTATDTVSLQVFKNQSVDFNSDGNNDLLWRNANSGDIGYWALNGAANGVASAQTSQFFKAVVPSSSGWDPVGAADFNNDGKTDLLWRNRFSGENGYWEVDTAGNVLKANPLAQVAASTGWDVAGVGDFNNDGNTDLLWRNRFSGDNAFWQLDGAGQIQSVKSLSSVATNTGWDVAGVGDFNGDGNTDILWRNRSSGENGYWEMNGAGSITQSHTISRVEIASGWMVGGVGDFNNNGSADILWRNRSTGDAGIWVMNGNSISSIVSLTPSVSPATGWNTVGANF